MLEALKGEKDISTIATENSIQPNLLRNWKNEFLEKASTVFDSTHDDQLKAKLEAERKEKTEYAKKVGQLTMQVDWLKKNLRNCSDLNTRLNILPNLSKTKELPVSVGAELLDVNRTSIYYKPKGISEEEIECKNIIDHLHTDNPTWGARQMAAQLRLRGFRIGRKKTRRYMT